MFSIKWNGDSVTILDQRLLPGEEVYHTYRHFSDLVDAIRYMEVRGAPLIGITAGMGIALAAQHVISDSLVNFRDELIKACDQFAATRPTAVNLFAAISRMKKKINEGRDIADIRQLLEKEALALYAEDIEANKTIGKNGSRFLNDGDVVLTHCNAGALATGGYGTALGVIRSAIEEGKKIQVYACETRPYLQGARLTAWELVRDGIPVTLITDSMSGHFMRTGVIKKVIVGADRITANGDVVNKIGTYTLSVLAREHKIPFYVAAPVSTLDPATKTGDEVTIEERGVDEVAYIGDKQIAPEGVFIRNPAFDMTPARNIAAIITDKGVIENPAGNGIAKALKQ
ncbi:MAG: S-methyl-5-thioribose-1-phosphate isomerase [Spirochaetes bacterium RBG_16_49_21]|nr:MAG: S-methyl-5-thioribose-1-phosphate isomerase [Spirochaetes bacterium RBG_16_49_21]